MEPCSLLQDLCHHSLSCTTSSSPDPDVMQLAASLSVRGVCSKLNSQKQEWEQNLPTYPRPAPAGMTGQCP